jgi:hypothetical protein
MSPRPEKALTKTIHIPPRSGVNYMQQTYRKTLREHFRCFRNLCGIRAVQATENAHGMVLPSLLLQEKPHGQCSAEQHGRRHDEANLEVVEPGNVDIPLAKN